MLLIHDALEQQLFRSLQMLTKFLANLQLLLMSKETTPPQRLQQLVASEVVRVVVLFLRLQEAMVAILLVHLIILTMEIVWYAKRAGVYT